MIKTTFRLGTDIVETIVKEGEILFSDVSSGQVTTIEGIKLNRSGVIKEFPDLENNDQWRKIAIERFKEHFKKLKTDLEKNNYVIQELTKFGYQAMFKQRAGFRPEKIKINGVVK